PSGGDTGRLPRVSCHRPKQRTAMYQLFSRLLGNRSARRSPSARPHRRGALRLEALEDRCVPATLFVDPNVTPSGSIFGSISAAVTAAHPGDTIKVVAGVYRGRVDINKPGLQSLGGQVRVSGEPSGPTHIFPPLLFPQGGGFVLDADNITVKGFVFHNLATAISTSSAHSGYHILNNDFFDSTVGI